MQRWPATPPAGWWTSNGWPMSTFPGWPSAVPRSSRCVAVPPPRRLQTPPWSTCGLWVQGTPDGDWTSMAVPSDGSYGVPEGLVSSFPVTTRQRRTTPLCPALRSASSPAPASMPRWLSWRRSETPSRNWACSSKASPTWYPGQDSLCAPGRWALVFAALEEVGDGADEVKERRRHPLAPWSR